MKRPIASMITIATKVGRDENNDSMKKGLGAISKAANRAAELTRQLLAYSGRAELSREVMFLPEVVQEVAALLRGGEEVRVAGRQRFHGHRDPQGPCDLGHRAHRVRGSFRGRLAFPRWIESALRGTAPDQDVAAHGRAESGQVAVADHRDELILAAGRSE